ncbi:MAG: ABC transporter substrate-binding protein [Acidobacteriia bacterium]|nr:ABC transporter substrate-binding protein [Methyloceanibacter sp.]MCL6492979.1 ABC transporter substrate-binding protein [Terriglobia bacterium]
MHLSRRHLIQGAAASAAIAPLAPARAQTPKISVGILNDLTGTYRDTTGPTSIACAKQAVQDFAASVRNIDVEIRTADHQNKPDVGASIARQWFDEGVDVILDVPTSSVALAVAQIARSKDKILLDASATTTALTGSQCSPNTIVWSFDTYMLAVSTGGAMVKMGGKTWYFITADYAFGHSLEEETTKVVLAAGGKVLGRSRYPFPETTDFSSYLQQAQASGAQVLGLANAGLDTENCVKQAHEFGLPESGMRIAPLEMFINDVHALGLKMCQGLYLTASFYWDLNDRTRAFTKRVVQKTPNNWPNQAQASNYGLMFHYLRTVADMGVAEAKKSGRATVERMKRIPTDDDAFGKGYIRADGRGVFPAYLFEVKSPAESKSPWDLYKLRAVTPAEQAVHPLGEGGCPLTHL